MITHVESKIGHPDCPAVRQDIQLRHDHETARLDDRLLDGHLRQCDACTAYRRDLDSLGRMLRTVPAAPFPPEALQELLADTVNRVERPSTFTQMRRLGVSLAAAAVLILAVIGAWFAGQPAVETSEYSEAQLVKLENDLHEVMLALGGTLQKSERLTVGDVLIREAAPALLVIPLRRDTPQH